jgi:hypothetical protein
MNLIQSRYAIVAAAYNMGQSVRSKKMAVSAFRKVATGYWTYPAENDPHRSWQIVSSQ